MDKDLKIAAAVRAQETWKSDMAKTLGDLHKEAITLTQQVSEHSISEMLSAELKVVNQRARACALVYGLADPARAFDDQPLQQDAPALTEEAGAAAAAAAESPAAAALETVATSAEAAEGADRAGSELQSPKKDEHPPTELAAPLKQTRRWGHASEGG